MEASRPSPASGRFLVGITMSRPKMTGYSIAASPSDGKVHGRLMGGPDQCLQFHPDAHMLDSWCMLAYPHEGQEHEYNREPSPEVPRPPWVHEMPA